jgi:threonine dehydrogenase-like Zn-dependent dehydrogenase
VPVAFSEGVDMIRKGGRYLVIGQIDTEKTTPFAPGRIVSKGIDVIGNLSATIPHYYKALQVIKNKRGKYPFGDIVTGKYSLEQVNEALAAMASGKEMKAVIDNRGR